MKKPYLKSLANVNALITYWPTLVSQVNAGDISPVQATELANIIKKGLVNPNGKYVYGLAGLAKLIGCSKPTALKIKNSGKIPFSKIGKKFIFDEEKVMSAISVKGGSNV